MADLAAAIREAESVRKLRTDELPRCALALARAFYDDPATRWLLPNDQRRMEVTRRGFLLFLRKIWFAQDECYATDGVVGAAIWERPGEWKLGLIQQLRLLPAMAVIYRRDFLRLMRALTVLESNHPDERHYYLPFIGVEPEWQGRGIGAALLRPILDRCDAEDIPAYLEASSPRNRVLYERNGFEVTEEFTLGKGSPPLWRMWREPVVLSGASERLEEAAA